MLVLGRARGRAGLGGTFWGCCAAAPGTAVQPRLRCRVCGRTLRLQRSRAGRATAAATLAPRLRLLCGRRGDSARTRFFSAPAAAQVVEPVEHLDSDEREPA